MSIADIIHNARAHERAMLEASRDVLEAWGQDAKAHMRQEAPWQDRTGHARYGNPRPATAEDPGTPAGPGLDVVPVHPAQLDDGGAVALIHGASYGKDLETSHGSDYAIIQPTVATEGPRLVEDLKEVWQ